MAWVVRFFQTARGNYPVKEFIENLDEATYAKTLHLIKLLSTNGPFLKPPYIKKIVNNLYELRISGKISVRILYTIVRNEYYLLHVFQKQSQKAPKKEFAIAIDRMKEII